MTCRLTDAKPLTEPMLWYSLFDPGEQISIKFEWKYNNFHRVIDFKIVVWKMAAILSQPRCVKMISREPLYLLV